MKGWTKEMVRTTVETNYPFCNGVTKDEALQLAHDLLCELKQARKETVEKFAERLKVLVTDRLCPEDYDWEDVQIDGQIFVECVDETAQEIIGEREDEETD